jgi:hypothetical protein
MVDVNGVLSEIETAALQSVVQSAVDAASQLGPSLSGLGSKLVSSIKGTLAGDLTPAQYAQLELDEQIDIDETAANMKPPNSTS